MRFYLCLIFTVTVFFVAGLDFCSAQCRTVRFHAPSSYGLNYSTGFDKGYTAAWNARSTRGSLQRWVRDWSRWVITNPAYVRGYRAGVKQALRDAKYLEEDNLSFSNFYGEEE